MILLENVSKTFQADGKVVEAVKNVNLSLREGKIHGIIGFSGAGKSTLVRCINLLERPTEGKVILGDVEITALEEKKLREERKKIGMIFQQFNLFASRTVFQNIAYPLKNSGLSRKEVENKVNYLLELVELKEKSGSYPSQLSGGQKQRVAIARALANDPKILLSDEATSALDPQTTKSILKLLKQLNEKLGITVIVITHEMQVVKEICDNVVVMENGRVVEQGDVFSIFANPVERITKDFVDSTSNLSKVHELINENAEIVRLKEGECILKFTYLKRDASEALVSHVSRSFELDVNIIFGNIEIIGGYPIGGLISVVSGRESSINDAINYLREKNVGVEVILDARVSK